MSIWTVVLANGLRIGNACFETCLDSAHGISSKEKAAVSLQRSAVPAAAILFSRVAERIGWSGEVGGGGGVLGDGNVSMAHSTEPRLSLAKGQDLFSSVAPFAPDRDFSCTLRCPRGVTVKVWRQQMWRLSVCWRHMEVRSAVLSLTDLITLITVRTDELTFA